MKYSKITAFILMSAALFAPAYAAESGAKPADSKPAEAKKAVADRSYVADYAGKKAAVAYIVNNREVPATYKETNGKDVVFVDSTGADMTVPHGSDKFKFVLKFDSDAMARARVYLNKDDLDSAISELRPIIYPMLPLCALSGKAFASADFLKVFVDALLESGRMKEAYTLARAVPIELLEADNIAIMMDIAMALIKKGEPQKAMNIVGKVELKEPAQFAASDSVLKVLAALRNAGLIKEVLPVYTKFGGTSNPLAMEFKIWGIYCDVSLGNKMSAEVYLNAVKVDRSVEAFSLLQMVRGDIFATHPKTPDLSAALDAYAEGIVFGKVSSEWMPELLYKAGMAYKAQQNFEASNEVFAQINAMYEGDPFAAKGMKEIVKIEKKAEQKGVSHEGDDDDDDDF